MRSGEQTLLQHLGELRRRVFICVVAVIVGSAAAFPFWEEIVELLARQGPEVDLIAIEITETLTTSIKVSLFAGFVLASPLVIFQAGMFVTPGLTGKEKRFMFAFLPGVLGAFVLGVAFSYFVLLPPLLGFLLSHGSDLIEIQPRVSNFVGNVLRLMFWMGLAFETPLIMYLLAQLGLVTARSLIKFFRYWVVVAFLLAAIITPTVDPYNQALVAVPLLVLYGIGILLAFVAGRSRSRSKALSST
ncbi:MAG: twin-arginine translocase subunit TatC [Dehalococcoidia bacterium]